MTLPRPVLVSSCAQPATDGGQKSWANRFDLPPGGRGRAGRRAAGRLDPHGLKRGMPVLWSRYVRSRFSCREACADHFGVTFQTACNWWDEVCAPAAAVYAQAMIEDGVRLHRVMVGAR